MLCDKTNENKIQHMKNIQTRIDKHKTEVEAQKENLNSEVNAHKTWIMQTKKPNSDVTTHQTRCEVYKTNLLGRTYT